MNYSRFSRSQKAAHFAVWTAALDAGRLGWGKARKKIPDFSSEEAGCSPRPFDK
jgi:hypothetical protein